MKKIIGGLLVVSFLAAVSVLAASPKKKEVISDDTQNCLTCHRELSPGIVKDWENSRHGRMTPQEGLKRTKLERRVSSDKIPGTLAGTVVGCAECHTLNAGKHKDSFEHNGYQVHVVVSPEDCATCHGKEAQQYGQNLMAKAYGNLMNNPVYRLMVEDINSTASFKEKQADPDQTRFGNQRRLLPFLPRNGRGGQRVAETGDLPGRDEFSDPDRLAQPGSGPGQPRRQPRFLRRLPQPPRIFH